MKHISLIGFRRLYRGLLCDFLFWLLLIAGYGLQFVLAFRGDWPVVATALSRMSLSLSQVGMGLSVLTVLIGLSDVLSMSSKFPATRSWYFFRFLLHVVVSIEALLFVLLTGPRVDADARPEMLGVLLSVGMGAGMVALVLVSMLESRSLLNGLSEVAASYGAGEKKQRRIRLARVGMTVSCIGELLSLLGLLVTQTLLLNGEFSVDDIALNLLHRQELGAGGVLLVAISLAGLAALAARAGAEVELVLRARGAWNTMHEISE